MSHRTFRTDFDCCGPIQYSIRQRDDAVLLQVHRVPSAVRGHRGGAGGRAFPPGRDPSYIRAMDDVIYTMVRAADWREAERLGEYHGSADDRRDGYLHFSAAAQLRASAAKHRAGERDLLLVAVEAAALGDALKWEPAGGGSRPGLFPHLYGPLPVVEIRAVTPLPLGPDGLHVFPPEIP